MIALEYVKEVLQQKGYTCVIFYNEEVVQSSYEKGILPLYSYIVHRKEVLQPLTLGDKVIGRAAALLAVYAGITKLYTNIISKGAIEVLEQHGVVYEYDEIVSYIENRNKNGQCPMEETVEHISSPEKGFEVLKEFIQRRNK